MKPGAVWRAVLTVVVVAWCSVSQSGGLPMPLVLGGLLILPILAASATSHRAMVMILAYCLPLVFSDLLSSAALIGFCAGAVLGLFYVDSPAISLTFLSGLLVFAIVKQGAGPFLFTACGYLFAVVADRLGLEFWNYLVEWRSEFARFARVVLALLSAFLVSVLILSSVHRLLEQFSGAPELIFLPSGEEPRNLGSYVYFVAVTCISGPPSDVQVVGGISRVLVVVEVMLGLVFSALVLGQAISLAGGYSRNRQAVERET